MKTQKTHIALMLFLLTIVSWQTTWAWQQKSLFETGRRLINIAASNNTEEILNLIDSKIDIDTKASILESFIQVKEGLFNTIGKNNLELFNVVKQNKFTYFILTYNNKFLFIRSKTNDKNLIVGNFALINSKVAQQLELGRKIYKMKCYSCHGKYGKGMIGPNLADYHWKYIKSDEDLINIIKNGKKGTVMIPYKSYLKPEEIEAVTLYIKVLQGKELQNAKKPEGDEIKVPFVIFKN